MLHRVPRIIAVSIAFIMALVGCAPVVWVKPGAQPGEFESTMNRCTYEADLATPNNHFHINRNTNDAIANSIVDGLADGIRMAMLKRECLIAAGWSQAPRAATVTATKSVVSAPSGPPTSENDTWLIYCNSEQEKKSKECETSIKVWGTNPFHTGKLYTNDGGKVWSIDLTPAPASFWLLVDERLLASGPCEGEAQTCVISDDTCSCKLTEALLHGHAITMSVRTYNFGVLRHDLPTDGLKAALVRPKS